MLDYVVILFVDYEKTLCPLFPPKPKDVLYVKDQRRQNSHSKP